MARIKYYFDTESSEYIRVQTRTIDVVINAIGLFLFSSGIAMIILVAYSLIIKSPKESRLTNELKEMEFNYSELNRSVVYLTEILNQIENRDEQIYRIVFGTEPVNYIVRHRARSVEKLNSKRLKVIDILNTEVDELKKKLYIESLSQDELFQLSVNKENLYAAIPAIQPISNKQLDAIASGFGLRVHPVYKVIRMHFGIDFAAPIGTPIYATADGEINSIEEKFDTYGKMIVMDHGYGYITRYAHLQEFFVRVGQKIKRGEQIGFVGNTGLSTAPHLHYEILINGKQIDPVHYFFNDLTPKEYEKVVELASIKNQSLGN
ncbi:MAG TPA: M23 family metallopeptidase [Cyclobacteriaceae bacterium]|jgi:murein DD-endopeptidase MepM/ murein hydrolase activator NlpD|nr:M23 family metallopeptidase [Cyclobacteriaceae bacterium]